MGFVGIISSNFQSRFCVSAENATYDATRQVSSSAIRQFLNVESLLRVESWQFWSRDWNPPAAVQEAGSVGPTGNDPQTSQGPRENLQLFFMKQIHKIPVSYIL